MNILTDNLPVTLEIEGREYPIDSDYRNCLRIILAFESDELTHYEKQVVLIGNLYGSAPQPLQAAILRANWFLNGGKDGDDDGPGGPRLYSFTQDANFIFAAFRQTHGIDLQEADLHWWEFLALFMDLGPDTTFSSLIGLRKRVGDGTATKEEKAHARAMGEMFDIPQPDTRTLDEREKEAEFMRLITGGK